MEKERTFICYFILPNCCSGQSWASMKLRARTSESPIGVQRPQAFSHLLLISQAISKEFDWKWGS